MADENEEIAPKTESKNNITEEIDVQSDDKTQEAIEQQPEETSKDPQDEEPQAEELQEEEPQAEESHEKDTLGEKPQEDKLQAEKHDENQAETIEESVTVLHAERSPTANIVESTEVPEMSRDRSVGKSDSTAKAAKSRRESEKPRSKSIREMSNRGLGSRARIVVGDQIDVRRSSVVGEVCDRRPPKYMNTYVMYSTNPFNAEKVMKILKSVMEEAMAHLTYDPSACVKQAKWASSAVRAKVRQLNFHRYKVVSVVTIGERHSQDTFTTCRFLWDAEKDRSTEDGNIVAEKHK